MEIEIGALNWLAVLVAAIVHFALGALWYGVLFASPWMTEMGMTREEVEAKGADSKSGYAIAFGGALVAGAVLALLIQVTGSTGAADGAFLGLLAGVGFLVTATAATNSFDGRSWKLWAINTGYPLVAFVLMGLVIGAWR